MVSLKSPVDAANAAALSAVEPNLFVTQTINCVYSCCFPTHKYTHIMANTGGTVVCAYYELRGVRTCGRLKVEPGVEGGAVVVGSLQQRCDGERQHAPKQGVVVLRLGCAARGGSIGPIRSEFLQP